MITSKLRNIPDRRTCFYPPFFGHFSLDDYYNQENFASDWFKIQKNLDEYIVKKNIHFAYAEATYQFTPRWIVNLGMKYDK